MSTTRRVTPSAIELRAANVCHAYVDCVTSASSTRLRRRRRVAIRPERGNRCQVPKERFRKLRLIARSLCAQMFGAPTRKSIFVFYDKRPRSLNYYKLLLLLYSIVIFGLRMLFRKCSLRRVMRYEVLYEFIFILNSLLNGRTPTRLSFIHLIESIFSKRFRLFIIF